MAAVNPFSVSPASFKILETESFTCIIAINKCSTVINSSPNIFRAALAFNNTAFKSLLKLPAGSPVVCFANTLI